MAKHITRLENFGAVFHKLGKVGVSADKHEVSTLFWPAWLHNGIGEERGFVFQTLLPA